MFSSLSGALWALSLALPSRIAAQSLQNTSNISPLSAFTYTSHQFLLHNGSYTILGGQIDPQRILYPYWRDRLHKARAMGLNTIFSYVYWNLLEPSGPSDWTAATDPQNNVTRFFEIAGEEGLRVVLRPGPYICGEREWGGFPAWLLDVPGIAKNGTGPVDVRSSNPAFLKQAKRYLAKLAKDLTPLQAVKEKDGPIIMVQVENEYGSYGADHVYTAAIRDALRESGWIVPLYTNDGTVDWTLAGGSVPDVLAETDGDPSSGFTARDQYITEASRLGPLLDGEYYTLAPDTWGSDRAHQHQSPTADNMAAFVKDIEFVLNGGNSISLYMFHGGTNFGFGNGAILRPPGYVANKTAAYLDVFTTSYDYGAPLDESGRTTGLFDVLRETILGYNVSGNVPDVPTNVPLMEVPDVTLEPVGMLFDVAGTMVKSDAPLPMEAMNQSYGYILYTHTITNTSTGILQPGGRPRDRVIVYVNAERKGVIDATYPYPANISLDLKKGDIVQLLVENLGRVDYWSLAAENLTENALLDPWKGVVGDVLVGETVLNGWDVTSYPLASVPELQENRNKTFSMGSEATPVFFRGSFSLPEDWSGDNVDMMARDTFLAVDGGTKGVVWVNGFNLGRFWAVGPQQSLYLPGTVLKTEGENEVVVLELEPGIGTIVVRGEAERRWENRADADYPLSS